MSKILGSTPPLQPTSSAEIDEIDHENGNLSASDRSIINSFIELGELALEEVYDDEAVIQKDFYKLFDQVQESLNKWSAQLGPEK